jgi:hypothetical protein
VFGGIETLTILVDNEVSGTGQEAARDGPAKCSASSPDN